MKIYLWLHEYQTITEAHPNRVKCFYFIPVDVFYEQGIHIIEFFKRYGKNVTDRSETGDVWEVEI